MSDFRLNNLICNICKGVLLIKPETVVLFIVLMLLTVTPSFAAEETAAGSLSSNQFERDAKCAGCHGIIHFQWEGGMHSLAELDPFYKKEAEMASIDTDGLTDTYCARCHTPIGVVSGELPPVDGSKLSDIAKRGVQCDFCHTVSGSAGINNAKFILTPGETKWGPFSDAESPYHLTEFSDLHTKAEFCGMCHDVNHPTNDLPLEATYTEWKEGPYSKEGVQCQDCHMTPGITQFEANPGKSASMGPKRDHIFTHYAVGGNAFITDIIGDKTHRDMAIERLQSAATLVVDAPASAEAGETVTVNVSITNSGAGHMLPTGLTNMREMWLVVIATDGDGNKFYHYGALDEKGIIDPDAVIYNTILGDADGNKTTKVWFAESIISDNRISPRETVFEEHTFTIPADAKDPVTISAKLQYRSAPQAIIDYLFDEGTYVVPVIIMAQASDSINSPDSDANTDSNKGVQTEPTTESTPGFGAFGLAGILTIIAIFVHGKRRV
ncbi:MAG: multiheme c-type cytochrome [Methanosarcinaceae archaeon]|nr:multiheme c-type cytochrome [Methanosarcinaceae archaeon]